MDQKRAFYKAIADGLHERLSLRRGDAFICLVEVSKENSSFGNGKAQYAKIGGNAARDEQIRRCAYEIYLETDIWM